MIKYKDIYAIEGVTLALTDWVIDDAWFPEIDATSRFSEVLEQLQQDNRLVVKQVVYKNFDGERYAAMHTLWFDGKPMAIVQDAGRGGRDYKQRWVTDVKTYGEALAYLLLLSLELNDVIDPEELVYEEHVCSFYGSDFSKTLGFENEIARTDVEIVRLDMAFWRGSLMARFWPA